MTGRTEKLRTQLAEALEQIPDAFALLDEFILPGSAPASPDGARSASSPSRPPLNLVVLDLQDTREKPDTDPQRTDYDLDRRAGARRQGVLPTLASWVRLVDGELWDEGLVHEPPADSPSVTTECVWLGGHVEWITGQQWAVEIADECSAILRDIRVAIGERTEPIRLVCPKCGWDLQGQGDYDKERGRHPWYRCAGCSSAITTASELDKASKEAEDFVTLKYAAKQIDRPYATLRWWRQQGWITPLGRDARGHIFSLAAIRKLNRKLPAKDEPEQISA